MRQSTYLPDDTVMMLVGGATHGAILWVRECSDDECPEDAHLIHRDIVSWS